MQKLIAQQQAFLGFWIPEPERRRKQAWTELCQAQVKLSLAKPAIAS